MATATIFKRTIKRLLYSFNVNKFFLERANAPIVLGFHRIKNISDGLLDDRVGTFSIHSFKSLLNYLQDIGYEYVPLTYLLEQKKGKLAAITFDDGYSDLYHAAFPHLRENNIPFTLFLITGTFENPEILWQHRLYLLVDKLLQTKGIRYLQENLDENIIVPAQWVGGIIRDCSHQEQLKLVSALKRLVSDDCSCEIRWKEELYLTKDQLMEMIENGLTIEAHGHKHLFLPRLSKKEYVNEIRNNIAWIKRITNRSPQYYAVAHGSPNSDLLKIIPEFGMKAVFDGNYGLIRSETDLFSLPRMWPSHNTFEFSFALTKELIRTS